MHCGSGIIGTVFFIFDCEANIELVVVGPDDKQALFCGRHIQGEVWDTFILVSTIFGKGNLKWSQKSIFQKLLIMIQNDLLLCMNETIYWQISNSSRE